MSNSKKSNNFVQKVKNMFEKKTEHDVQAKDEKSEKLDGFVHKRKQEYENLTANSRSNAVPNLPSNRVNRNGKKYNANNISNNKSENSNESTSPPLTPKAQLKIKRNGSQGSLHPNNVDKTPSKVANNDDICIYRSPGIVYGSFKRRPKFSHHRNDNLNENDVLIRLKAEETELKSIGRYQSILKCAPLFQQSVMVAQLSPGIVTSNRGSPGNSQGETPGDREGDSRNVMDQDLMQTITTVAEGAGGVLEELRQKRHILWYEMEQVVSSGIHKTLNNQEITYNEAKFELVSSEASYARSLAVLVDTFYRAPQFTLLDQSCVLRPYEKEHLFSNILRIYDVSTKFLAALEAQFIKDIRMRDICKVVTRFAKSSFQEYVPYIQNQKFQTDAYNELKKQENVRKVIDELESRPECCYLSLDSFLLLPMQRLLRMQLLLKAILKFTPQHKDFETLMTTKAIHATEQVIEQCSEKKDHMDERTRMLHLCNRLVFRATDKAPSLTAGRLLREGELKRSPRNSRAALQKFSSFFVRFHDLWFVLTSEYLLMTRISYNSAKERIYHVDDFCKLSDITAEYCEMDASPAELMQMATETPATSTTTRFRIRIQKQDVAQNSTYHYVVLARTRQDSDAWLTILRDSCDSKQD